MSDLDLGTRGSDSVSARYSPCTVLAPWTQSITISWRPELRFYEKRYELLRALEEREQMWAFRVDDDRVEARLFDRWHQIALTPTSASMHFLSPRPDEDQGLDALGFVVEGIAPKTLGRVVLAFQFLVELPLAFDAAVERGRDTIFTRVEAGGMSLDDWAVLMDLSMATPRPARGQVEFGILSSDEIPARLARGVGRTQYSFAPSVAHDAWEDFDLPATALFADLRLTTKLEGHEDSVASAVEFWKGAREEAATLVMALKGKLIGDEVGKEVAS